MTQETPSVQNQGESANTLNAPISTQSHVITPTPEPERMVPQSKVDEMVRHSNANVAAKARKEAIEQYQAQMGQPKESSSPSQNVTASFNTETIEQIAAKEVQKQLQNVSRQQYEQQMTDQGQKIATEYTSKMNEGIQHYPDLAEKMNGLLNNLPGGYGDIVDIVALANGVDNTSDVMYELASNPEKIAMIRNIGQVSPMLAQQKIREIAEAAKLNRQAKKVKTPDAPLSRIQPNPLPTDNGSRSIRDYQRMLKENGGRWK